jgi:hypothetical protein
MRIANARASVRLVTLLLGGLLACGGDDICLQCPSGTPTPGQSGVIVTGSILNSVNPSTVPSAITVIVCVGLDPGQSVTECQNSFYATPNTDGDFTRNNVSAGSETIFFWVDADMNGTVDPDDPVSQLTDSQGLLEDVEAGQTVTIANARINFLADTTAEISVTLTPTPTPTAPTATPTPTATP